MATQSFPEAGNPASTHPDPSYIWQILNAYQSSFALTGAVELDLFTHLADGPLTAAQLGARAGASERGVRILADYLVVIGLLTKNEGAYALTPQAAVFLNKRSPAYIGSAAFFLTHPMQVAGYKKLTDAVRKGGTVNGEGAIEPENPIWVEFARWMAPASAMGAMAIAEKVTEMGRPIKVLDIAAGPGAYGIAVAKRNPLAEVYALDWKNVLEVSMENARKAGVENRYHGIAGSAFDTHFGNGYDLILVPNFLHHFDRASNVALLKKVKAALAPDGRVATVEFVPNDDRTAPPIAAAFGLTMLVGTPGGDVYTFAEYDSMFREAGFGKSEEYTLAPSPQTLIVSKA